MNSLKKRIYISVTFIAFAIIFIFSTGYAQPEIISIDNTKAYDQKQRPPVNFKHELHMESLECMDCHHKYENSENVLSEDELEEGNPEILCSSCHNYKTSINLQKASHRQCMGCHKKYAKEGEATGPRLCGECHIR